MRLLFGLLAITALLSSCSVEDREIPTLVVGQDFTDSNVRLVTVDTFTVKLTTFKFDSINTSTSNRLLVGSYYDDFFGRVSSQSYFELSAINYTIPSDAELDSIALILGYDGYFYNDTTQLAEINVYRLLEEVSAEDDVFYNTSQLTFDTVPVVTRRFFPEPTGEDSLHIQIPLAFGRELFDLIQENDINSDREVREKLKGFTLRPSNEENTAVIGFSRDPEITRLRFFYSIPGEFEDDEEAFDLFINQNTGLPRAFNQIQSDVTGMLLDTLTDQEINLPSELSGNFSFIQSGVGHATRIEFPTLTDIGQIPGTGTILDAILEIKPPVTSYNDNLPIRDSLNVQIVDQNNVITETIVNGNGAVFARINEANSEFNDIFYQIPLVTYLDQELAQIPEVEDAVIIYPKNYNQTVDRIVLQGAGSSDFEAKLILTYAIYDE
ncbi:DUF4270 domain-containing protein [Flavobacteriaceae bacterium TP-CH-4]|uniref:DUF4270 domain-containing protein n=1 Tax=Pelagihabitans pacificus TaxID=2696054 RepID=A0A967AUG8_9FLAO|nr:DUF4270 family protein [Pelagihabitans pacificus]NHF59585.1 DUF4270 domain-containing protein [Pelagihabitans pacificus]